MKNANSKPYLGVFLAATDSEHKIIQILHRKGQNKIWTELSSLGQEPAFKAEIFPTVNEVPLHTAFHYHLSIVLI